MTVGLIKEFDWSSLGDVSVGRENLGQEMPVVVYRLLQYTLVAELTDLYGEETAEEITRNAGRRAGYAFAKNLLAGDMDFSTFISALQKTLKDMKIGILRIEKADLEKLELVLTIGEDLDCSGLSVTGETVCVYDEGFIAGILYYHTDKEFTVIETDCWATGDRTCRFTAKAKLD